MSLLHIYSPHSYLYLHCQVKNAFSCSCSLSLCVSLFISHTVLQQDLADMQLLVQLKMETTQKVFGQRLLMANIYQFHKTTACVMSSVSDVCFFLESILGRLVDHNHFNM